MHAEQVVRRCGGNEDVCPRARELHRGLPVDRLVVLTLVVRGAQEGGSKRGAVGEFLHRRDEAGRALPPRAARRLDQVLRQWVAAHAGCEKLLASKVSGLAEDDRFHLLVARAGGGALRVGSDELHVDRPQLPRGGRVGPLDVEALRLGQRVGGSVLQHALARQAKTKSGVTRRKRETQSSGGEKSNLYSHGGSSV